MSINDNDNDNNNDNDDNDNDNNKVLMAHLKKSQCTYNNNIKIMYNVYF